MDKWTVLHLFCGLGGGGLGFKRAGFHGLGAIDSDPAACRDYETLTGEKATVADLSTITPEGLRVIVGPRRPDVLFTSPPCKSFSGCLPAAKATTDKYVGMSNLALRGIWVALEAWGSTPPPLIVLENVPRIQSRGAQWLRALEGLLRGYGYAVRGSTHDCGVLGELAQHRRRFLLVARHIDSISEVLYEPPKKRVLGIGDVFDALPVPAPGSTAGGPMHRLPRMSPLNWLRLAAIPAGKDWRALPSAIVLNARKGRQNGGYGVNEWGKGSHTVVAHSQTHATWSSVADPRLNCAPRTGVYGLRGWDETSRTVTGAASPDNGSWAIADPRLDHAPRAGCHSSKPWEDASGTVIGNASPHKGFAIADPRVTCARRNGSLGVKSWDEPATTVIGHASVQNWPGGVADPRLVQSTHWLEDGEPLILHGPIADMRSGKAPCYMTIQALDGTWHRPMTTLELAVLQGFPAEINGKPLVLDGRSHAGWRQRIGNAVPPPAAEAVARQMIKTLQASADGSFLMSSDSIWVQRRA